jgi:hypothetical protein
MSGNAIQTSASMISAVATPLPTLGNRFFLIHPTRPTVAAGGDMKGAGAART